MAVTLAQKKVFKEVTITTSLQPSVNPFGPVRLGWCEHCQWNPAVPEKGGPGALYSGVKQNEPTAGFHDSRNVI